MEGAVSKCSDRHSLFSMVRRVVRGGAIDFFRVKMSLWECMCSKKTQSKYSILKKYIYLCIRIRVVTPLFGTKRLWRNW